MTKNSWLLHCVPHVNRDLKPENLLYSDTSIDSPLKLADFGLAKLLDETVLMHTACGTPGYVAPEILEGRPYGQEVDLWSVGVISYILLCGFPPFYADDNATLFRTIKSGRYEYPSPFWDDVSDQAKDFIDHLLVLDPQKRLTADQALQHQWITGQAEGTAKLLSHFHASMRSYNLRRKFRASILTLQALNMMKKMGAEVSLSRENSPARSAQHTPLSTNRSDFDDSNPQPDSANSRGSREEHSTKTQETEAQESPQDLQRQPSKSPGALPIPATDGTKQKPDSSEGAGGSGQTSADVQTEASVSDNTVQTP